MTETKSTKRSTCDCATQNQEFAQHIIQEAGGIHAVPHEAWLDLAREVYPSGVEGYYDYEEMREHYKKKGMQSIQADIRWYREQIKRGHQSPHVPLWKLYVQHAMLCDVAEELKKENRKQVVEKIQKSIIKTFRKFSPFHRANAQ